jgi:fucose permease
MFLLPLFLITQTLQYLDKTALNYAKVFGMEKAMGMTGNQFSLGAAIFYMYVDTLYAGLADKTADTWSPSLYGLISSVDTTPEES